MAEQNIVSVSGGKDSTATLLLAIALETENLQAVFADTGNEHEQTYQYLDYLELATGVRITRVQANFTRQIAGKRQFVATKWREQGIDESVVLAALEVLRKRLGKSSTQPRKAKTWCALKFKWAPVLAF
ncbi:phosphoadenosine phosphosulfate reductase family protein [Pseudomonas syringae]